MSRCTRRRRDLPLFGWPHVAACSLAVAGSLWTARAQDVSNAPASVPAGIQAPVAAGKAPVKPVSEKQAREADDSYLQGAKAMQRGEYDLAAQEFSRAVDHNPGRPEYALSLSAAREHQLSALVREAATARRSGNTSLADTLLAQARAIDPDNRVVTQHFDNTTQMPEPTPMQPVDPSNGRPYPQFGPGVELKPSKERRSFHENASPEQVLRDVYRAFGIQVQFPSPLPNNGMLRFDLDDVDYPTASRVADKIASVFAVPVQPDSALLVQNTQENRDQYEPVYEETLYMPGVTGDSITELANVARQVFDLQKVSASLTAGNMLVRGDKQTLELLNATYADLLTGGADVELDISLYEVDKNFERNYGVQTPGSVGIFSYYSEAETLIAQNQSVINAAISQGLITLNGNLAHDLPLEIGVLAAAGLLNISQVTGLLGTLGTFSGIPLAGVYLGSGTTVNLLLSATDTRMLDFAQLRAGDHQATSFRVGTRYPVITGTYSSGITSAALSGLSAAQQSLVQQYLGASTSVSIPQFQFEDLGLTIKAVPTVHQNDVTLQLDMKLEALGGASINNIPILNSRALQSTITVPAGQTALLASLVDTSEMRSISGVPGLSEIPGFQGTDRDTVKDSAELLITITPHIVRVGHREAESRRLAYEHSAGQP